MFWEKYGAIYASALRKDMKLFLKTSKITKLLKSLRHVKLKILYENGF